MALFRGCIKIAILLLIFAGVFIYREFNIAQVASEEALRFEVQQGESLSALAERLEDQDIIRSATWFKRYVQLKGIDKKIQVGEVVVEPPITLGNIAQALIQAQHKKEQEITILPGWTNRDIADYLAKQEIGSEQEILNVIGASAQDYRVEPFSIPAGISEPAFVQERPAGATFEGYLAPDTYRIFDNASVEDVVQKLLDHRQSQISNELLNDIAESGRSVHEVMIIASLLEKEVRTAGDKALVADIFWRRLDSGWALQADSTVHYFTNKKGSVFTSAADRDVDSPWNTYKHPGLPLGPISNPSLESIVAAVHPEPNNYWYFITTLDSGEVHYGRTLDEHNQNVQRYLR